MRHQGEAKLWAGLHAARSRRHVVVGHLHGRPADRGRSALALGPPPGQRQGRAHDAALALKEYERAPRTEGDWEEKLEDRIFSLSASAAPKEIIAGDKSEIEDYLSQAIEGELRAPLDRAGHWTLNGEIEIANGRHGL